MSNDGHGVVTAAEITHGLRALGVAAGGTLLVHSSLKSFGHVEGGADAVIDALLAAVGPEGTVMVPTLTGRRQDSPADPPVFDVRHTPCWTGLIPETFRRRPQARRSLNATHSVAAIGPRTDFLVRDHLFCQLACGPNSPYVRLAELDGQVVFLGVDLSCCTLLHGAEELAGCAYHLQPVSGQATITDEQGRTCRREVRLHDWGTPRGFTVMEPIFLQEGLLRVGRVGLATVRVLRARGALARTVEILRATPRFLCATP